MIRAQDEGPATRELFQSGRLQAEEDFAQRGDAAAKCIPEPDGDGPRLQDLDHIRVSAFAFEDLIPSSLQPSGRGPLARNDGVDQFADGIDLRDHVGVGLGLQRVLEGDHQFHALHGIETQLKFKIVTGVDRLGVLGGCLDDGDSLLDYGICEPLRFFLRQRPLFMAHGPGRLLGLHLPLDLVALQLAGGGARQLRLPDLVTEDALTRCHLGGEAFDVKADHFLHVDDLFLAQDVHIRNHDRVEALTEWFPRSALQPHHAHLLDPWALQIMRFNLLGVDVLAGTEDDHVLLAPGDE